MKRPVTKAVLVRKPLPGARPKPKPKQKPKTESNPQGAGQPAFEPTRAMREAVQTMAGLGMKHDAIRRAVILYGKPISRPTLRKHFREELINGESIIKSELASAFLKGVRGGNQTLIILGMKSLFGMKETNRTEHTGADGEPIAIADLTDAQLDAYIKRLSISNAKKPPSGTGSEGGTETGA